MDRSILIALALIAPLAACSGADESGTPLSSDEGAAVTSSAKETILQIKPGTKGAGLRMEFAIRKQSASERHATVALERPSKPAMILGCTTTGSVRPTEDGAFSAVTCVYSEQPGYAPGVNACELVFNRDIKGDTEKWTVKAGCRNPGPISAEQKTLLELVHGGATNYKVYPNRTFSSSTGEVTEGELEIELDTLASNKETDPWALLTHLNAASKKIMKKEATSSYGQPLAADKRGPNQIVTVFPELEKMQTSVNFITQRGVAVGKGASLLADDGDVASQTELAKRIAALVDAQ